MVLYIKYMYFLIPYEYKLSKCLNFCHFFVGYLQSMKIYPSINARCLFLNSSISPGVYLFLYEGRCLFGRGVYTRKYST